MSLIRLHLPWVHTCLLLSGGGAVRGNPKEEGLLGTAAVKEQDYTKMLRPRF